MATRLFTEGDGALKQLLGKPIATDATLRLIKYAKEVCQELLDQQRNAVERSCGGPITKDLALGTLLGDALWYLTHLAHNAGCGTLLHTRM